MCIHRLDHADNCIAMLYICSDGGAWARLVRRESTIVIQLYCSVYCTVGCTVRRSRVVIDVVWPRFSQFDTLQNLQLQLTNHTAVQYIVLFFDPSHLTGNTPSVPGSHKKPRSDGKASTAIGADGAIVSGSRSWSFGLVAG